MVKFREYKHKGCRFSIAAAWSTERGWYRFVITWHPSAGNPSLRPLRTVYHGGESAIMAACIFGEEYGCL